nr:unnamed protein product [Digitaria exilis]
MDAVAFPPPPPPFLDDDFDFGDFTFAPAPQPTVVDPRPAAFAAFDDDWGDFVASDLGSNADASAPPTPPTASATSSWEKPRGPLPLSLFGADDDQEEAVREEEAPAGPPSTAAADWKAPAFLSNGSRPADLKDLIAGLYGSQPAPAVGAADEGPQVVAEDGEGFEGDDDWEFTAATAEPADQDGGGRAPGDEIGKVEDLTKSLSTDQEDWSSFTSVDDKSNHVGQTADDIGSHESTGECVKASSYPPANNSAILNLYKESDRADTIDIVQNSAESVQNPSDLFSINEMNSSFQADENHSTLSASDSILIEFYHRLREESLAAIFRHVKDLKEAQKVSTVSDENGKATAIGREIQAIEDTSVAVELYKHSVSTLRTLELASKEEKGGYISAWYSMLRSCAQELQHGAAIWQESCHANVCDRIISEGTDIWHNQ